MSKPAAARLIPKVPTKVPRVGARRTTRSSTKRELVAVAEELFAEQGYPATSLDQIVGQAQVTKGALYHHFSGKQALFEAVFERVEAEARASIQAGLKDQRDPWLKAQAGLRAFLDVVQQPAYRRIVVLDGPSVLGYERFREQEERSTFAIVVEIVRAVLTAGEWDDGEVDEEMLQTFTRVFFGAMSSAGTSVASSDDPALAAQRVEAALGFILTGLRSLADAGVPLPDPAAGRDSAR
ncbi:TetR/AcrR family transcriptional regulator [Nocardioides currus]|uniref:TetR/AcrR family transcriptional regulator n=1 Tax=Nocardioides currus TaxID=2133958 RepID=A0A2R7YXB8_9ACTN|nr:TetR/AcrR family transcriptional regulator [Nocardioides currus]PUA81028.1 TetR/AcrR family transcriptional regulator [Nocardioides currus]